MQATAHRTHSGLDHASGGTLSAGIPGHPREGRFPHPV